jgi:hypothetical protein
VGAGIMKGKHQGYGATTTSRHVHFGASEKYDAKSDKLLHWNDLRMAASYTVLERVGPLTHPVTWQQDNEYILTGHR